MKKEYAEVFQSEDAVDKYDEVVYASGSPASAINDRYVAFLRSFVASRYSQPPVQHDFACGTGRAMTALDGHVAAAHGYDTSADMIAKAKNKGVKGTFHLVAPDGPVPDPADHDGPSLVTIFRLLLNTAPDVHDRALEFAARALPTSDSGYLVVENHGSRRSLRHLLKPLHRNDEWFNELSHREVAGLFDRHGFQLEETHGFAVLPSVLHRGPLRRPSQWIDDWSSRQKWLDRWSINVLYVGRRAN
ncbi:MAG: class I SAM-dependent methyltransferase [Rhodococcus sp.]|nr:class I SAM-dependent methyltransferase [Rhodococcus sp. (in: high G+C Gram-positive bacteria)]